MENNENLKVVICAMAKCENAYINDWCKYHLNLGFDEIYLYDNNDFDYPYVGDAIQADLKDRIHIIDIRGRREQNFQFTIYKQFYFQNRDKFDWCAFIDIDEYFEGITDLKNWLGNIPNQFKQVRVKWNLFGDDEMLDRDRSISVYDAFKHIKRFNFKSNFGKFIIRNDVDDFDLCSAHFASTKTLLSRSPIANLLDARNMALTGCLPSGKPCISAIIIKENYNQETIFLNHYMTKTLAEFLDQKMNRADVVFKFINLGLPYYFAVNNFTEEKRKYLEERGIIYNNKNKLFNK